MEKEARKNVERNDDQKLNDLDHKEDRQLENKDDFPSPNGKKEHVLHNYEQIIKDISEIDQTIDKQKTKLKEILDGRGISTAISHRLKHQHSMGVFSLRTEEERSSDSSIYQESNETNNCEENNRDQAEDVDDRKKTSFLGLMKPFMESSTLHGISRLANSSIWVRVIWMLAMAGAITALTMQIVGLTQDYLNFGVVTEITVRQGDLTPPVLTVCNDRPFLASRLVQLPLFSNLSGDITDPSNKMMISERLYRHYNDLKPEDLVHLGANISDTVAIDTYPNEEEPQVKLLPFHGSCYTIHFPPETINIQVAFNLHADDSISQFGRDPGISVYLKDDSYAYPFYEPMNEIMVDAGVEKGGEVTHKVISRLNDSYAQCQDNEPAFYDKTWIAYEQSACQRECEFKIALSVCKCLLRNQAYFSFWILHTRGKRNSYPECNVEKEKDCISKVGRNPSLCKCKPKCNANIYETIDRGEDSLSHINCIKNPKQSLCKRVRKWVPPNATEEWYNRNIAAVILVMTQKSYKTYTQKPDYPFLRFLSDIGGSMGFYLGASMLTYFEVIHFGLFNVKKTFKLIKRKFIK